MGNNSKAECHIPHSKFYFNTWGVKKGQYTMLHWILLISYTATTSIFSGTVTDK